MRLVQGSLTSDLPKSCFFGIELVEAASGKYLVIKEAMKASGIKEDC